MQSSSTRVKTFIVWLVIAVSFPLFLFTAGAIWHTHEADRQQEEGELSEIALSVAERFDLGIDGLKDSLGILTESAGLLGGDQPRLMRELETLSARTDATIRIVGPDGKGLMPANATDSAIMAVVRNAIQNDTSGLTDLLPGESNQSRSIALIVPGAPDGDRRPGVALVAILHRPRLLQLANPPRLGPPGIVITIFDQDGEVVSRSIQATAAIGLPAPPALRQAIRRGQSGLMTVAMAPDAVRSVVGFSHAAVSGYTAAASLPESAFLAARRQELVETAAIGFVLLLASLLAAMRLSGRLVNALRAIGRDDAAAVVRYGLQEVDELADRTRAIALQRDATEASLRESEAQLRALVGTLDLAAFMTRELDGTIRFWSLGCVRMYGWAPEEAIGQCSHTLLRTEFPRSLAEVESALLEHGSWTGDLVHRRKDGSRIVAAANKVLERGRDGTPDLVMESLVDVTALREAEERLRAMNQDLEQRVQTEIAAREAAQKRAVHSDRIQALGQLAGGIAHDFNNILQAIAGSAALIARHPRDADMVARFIAIISDAAARGASITRRILLLARRGDLKAEPIDAEALLTGLREVFMYTLGAAIRIELDVPSRLPHLIADKTQLETALVNLATNARDAMPDGGVLWMTAATETVAQDSAAHPANLTPGEYVRLSVIDNGIGMSASTLARVGEPFFTTKGLGKGTGLGLSMVKGFAEQSGGGLAIESEPGQGTTASIWVPVSPAQVTGIPRSAADFAQGIAQILLVDDDPLVRDTVAEQLEDLGHKVLSASDGTDALDILRAREAIDLMITDLSMPGMNGLMLIQEARMVRPTLPAILLTGYASDAAAMTRTADTRQEYSLIRKPASTAVLKARISELLSRV